MLLKFSIVGSEDVNALVLIDNIKHGTFKGRMYNSRFVILKDFAFGNKLQCNKLAFGYMNGIAIMLEREWASY